MSKLDETLLYRWFHQVWNSKDGDSKKAIETLMAADAEFDGIETKEGQKGAEGNSDKNWCLHKSQRNGGKSSAIPLECAMIFHHILFNKRPHSDILYQISFL